MDNTNDNNNPVVPGADVNPMPEEKKVEGEGMPATEEKKEGEEGADMATPSQE